MEAWNSTSSVFESIAFDILCYNDKNQDVNKSEMVNCHMFFEVDASPYSLGLFRMTYNSTIDHERKPYDSTKWSGKDYIQSGDKSQNLLAPFYDKDNDEYLFLLEDKDFNTYTEFAFGMKYWPSYCNFKHGSNSGAYAFRPIDRLYNPIHYTDLKSISIYNETQLV